MHQPMICPACGQVLKEVVAGDIRVDVCPGCYGLWLDNFELEKVDEAHESAGEILLDFQPPEAKPVETTGKRRCPKCRDVVMQRFFFSVKREVEIDDCPGCGGNWLDVTELARMRAEYPTEAARKAAGSALFAKLFDKDLAAQAAISQADLERAQRFAKSLKYVLPSYWIPGKQSWGTY